MIGAIFKKQSNIALPIIMLFLSEMFYSFRKIEEKDAALCLEDSSTFDALLSVLCKFRMEYFVKYPC